MKTEMKVLAVIIAAFMIVSPLVLIQPAEANDTDDEFYTIDISSIELEDGDIAILEKFTNKLNELFADEPEFTNDIVISGNISEEYIVPSGTIATLGDIVLSKDVKIVVEDGAALTINPIMPFSIAGSEGSGIVFEEGSYVTYNDKFVEMGDCTILIDGKIAYTVTMDMASNIGVKISCFATDGTEISVEGSEIIFTGTNKISIDVTAQVSSMSDILTLMKNKNLNDVSLFGDAKISAQIDSIALVAGEVYSEIGDGNIDAELNFSTPAYNKTDKFDISIVENGSIALSIEGLDATYNIDSDLSIGISGLTDGLDFSDISTLNKVIPYIKGTTNASFEAVYNSEVLNVQGLEITSTAVFKEDSISEESSFAVDSIDLRTDKVSINIESLQASSKGSFECKGLSEVLSLGNIMRIQQGFQNLDLSDIIEDTGLFDNIQELFGITEDDAKALLNDLIVIIKTNVDFDKIKEDLKAGNVEDIEAEFMKAVPALQEFFENSIMPIIETAADNFQDRIDNLDWESIGEAMKTKVMNVIGEDTIDTLSGAKVTESSSFSLSNLIIQNNGEFVINVVDAELSATTDNTSSTTGCSVYKIFAQRSTDEQINSTSINGIDANISTKDGIKADITIDSLEMTTTTLEIEMDVSMSGAEIVCTLGEGLALNLDIECDTAEMITYQLSELAGYTAINDLDAKVVVNILEKGFKLESLKGDMYTGSYGIEMDYGTIELSDAKNMRFQSKEVNVSGTFTGPSNYLLPYEVDGTIQNMVMPITALIGFGSYGMTYDSADITYKLLDSGSKLVTKMTYDGKTLTKDYTVTGVVDLSLMEYATPNYVLSSVSAEETIVTINGDGILCVDYYTVDEDPEFTGKLYVSESIYVDDYAIYNNVMGSYIGMENGVDKLFLYVKEGYTVDPTTYTGFSIVDGYIVLDKTMVDDGWLSLFAESIGDEYKLTLDGVTIEDTRVGESVWYDVDEDVIFIVDDDDNILGNISDGCWYFDKETVGDVKAKTVKGEQIDATEEYVELKSDSFYMDISETEEYEVTVVSPNGLTFILSDKFQCYEDAIKVYNDATTYKGHKAYDIYSNSSMIAYFPIDDMDQTVYHVKNGVSVPMTGTIIPGEDGQLYKVVTLSSYSIYYIDDVSDPAKDSGNNDFFMYAMTALVIIIVVALAGAFLFKKKA